MEINHHQENSPESDKRFEQLAALAAELDYVESEELRDLHTIAVRALAEGEDDEGVEALAVYKRAAATWVEARSPTSYAPIGYRIAVAAIWLKADVVDQGLDELWETAYQAGQTPGIESLRETLEDFVTTYDNPGE